LKINLINALKIKNFEFFYEIISYFKMFKEYPRGDSLTRTMVKFIANLYDDEYVSVQQMTLKIKKSIQ